MPFAVVPRTIATFPNPADVNGNGSVDFADILQVIIAWGPCPEPCDVATCAADVNGNCAVDFADILIIIETWDT